MTLNGRATSGGKPMGHTSDAPEPINAVAPEDDGPTWDMPGHRRSSELTGGSVVGLVLRATELFAAFAGDAEGATPAGQVVAMRTLLDQCEALWLGAAQELESSGAIAEAGFGSLTSWLRHCCRLAPGEAAGRSKVAAAVTGAPGATAAAMLSGAVTWRHALIINQALAQLPVDSRPEAERSLIEHGRTLDPGQLRRVADRLVHCFDRQRADDAAIRKLDRRGLSVAETMDGMVSVSGLLDPVTGSLLMTALHTKLRPRPASDHGDGHGFRRGGSDGEGRGDSTGGASEGDEVRTWAQRRADALAEICQEWLQDTNGATVGGVRPHLSVIVDHSTLATRVVDDPSAGIQPGQLAWVGPITASQAQMIGCDASVSRILTDGPSQVLDVGRATRTIPPALRRAVAARDRSCVGPGCHRPPEHCDVHHIVFWEHGGDTSLDNTVLVCRRHHGLVHLKQWQIRIDADGRRRLEPPG